MKESKTASSKNLTSAGERKTELVKVAGGLLFRQHPRGVHNVDNFPVTVSPLASERDIGEVFDHDFSGSRIDIAFWNSQWKGVERVDLIRDYFIGARGKFWADLGFIEVQDFGQTLQCEVRPVNSHTLLGKWLQTS
jgi:hypothetical protein